MTAPSKVVADAPIHYPASVSRMHDLLTYQCDAQRLMAHVEQPADQMGVFSANEMAAMKDFYAEGVSASVFVAFVLDARLGQREMRVVA